MIPKGLFTQIAMMIVAGATVITYIMPTLKEITAVQDEILKFETKKEEVFAVNSKLATLLSEVASISNEDQKNLINYLPNEVDDIAVPRDLFLISKEAGVLYVNSSFDGLNRNNNSSSATEGPVLSESYNFSLSVEGTYSQLKKLFSLLEKNYYPLQVNSLDITKLNGPFLSAEIGLVTYEYKDPVPVQANAITF